MTTLTTRFVQAATLLATLATVACEAPADTVAVEASASDVERVRGVYADRSLYTDPDSSAAEQADLWRSSRADDAAVMDAIAAQPVSLWLGDWMDDVTEEVDDALDDAKGGMRSFVVYNIPDRDCGNWSEGGVSGATEYGNFIDDIADGLQGRLAIVILEPDALAVIDCLDSWGESERKDMMSDAVDTLTAAGAAVYIDAGDSNWVPADEMAEQLLDAGVENAAGFALNVSHTEFSEDEMGYAEELRAIIGTDAHYVIDTSRNGNGPSWDNEWCNPEGRANGRVPTLRTSRAGLDAMLWVKPPGESDGYCNGGPDAGYWWADYALDLAVEAGL